jgi:hypothetical protein
MQRGRAGLAPLGVAVAMCAAAAALAVVSLSAQPRRDATALASLRSAGTWPSAAPSYEPHVGDVLSKQAVRDYHPRRPGGRSSAASATSGEPLVTAQTEREVTAAACRAVRRAPCVPPRACRCVEGATGAQRVRAPRCTRLASGAVMTYFRGLGRHGESSRARQWGRPS